MKKTILILFSLFTFSTAFAQSGYNLQFSQAILVQSTSQTVPSGKVWKVVSVQRNTNGNYNSQITINGTIIYVGGGYQDGVTQHQKVSNLGNTFPIWLPAGTTIKAEAGVEFLSVLEFNLISN
tara:strand:+ start:440 stop:808 length:369 start_codon:yes stop_codon:yes gene_type:complete